MIELVLIVCLKTAPEQCEERSILQLAQASLVGCMIGAPPMLAEWAEAHPRLSVARWTCAFEGTRAEDA